VLWGSSGGGIRGPELAKCQAWQRLLIRAKKQVQKCDYLEVIRVLEAHQHLEASALSGSFSRGNVPTATRSDWMEGCERLIGYHTGWFQISPCWGKADLTELGLFKNALHVLLQTSRAGPAAGRIVLKTPLAYHDIIIYMYICIYI
jgi:hypothetical protein